MARHLHLVFALPTMMAWRFLFVLGAIALHFTAAGAPKPNVIIFLVDDMGVMDTSLPGVESLIQRALASLRTRLAQAGERT